MKKRNWIIASLLAGTIGVAGMAHACGGPGGHFRGDHRNAPMMQIMKNLDLSKEQRQAIRDIRNESRDQMEEKRDEMTDIRKALREQARADTYDAAKVRELANAKSLIMSDMTVQRIETMNRVRKQLTPEQVAELDSFKDRGFGRGKF